VNDIVKAMWWDLTDTVKMMIEDWTLNWCKEFCCTKQQQNEVKVHFKWLIQIS